MVMLVLAALIAASLTNLGAVFTQRFGEITVVGHERCGCSAQGGAVDVGLSLWHGFLHLLGCGRRHLCDAIALMPAIGRPEAQACGGRLARAL